MSFFIKRINNTDIKKKLFVKFELKFIFVFHILLHFMKIIFFIFNVNHFSFL
jgi:hypothetical protein